MALSQSALSDLLDALRSGDGVDLIRESVRIVMQELIETEAAERIGAARYERSPSRVTERNGSRRRLVSTQAGDIQLRIRQTSEGLVLPRDPGGHAAAAAAIARWATVSEIGDTVDRSGPQFQNLNPDDDYDALGPLVALDARKPIWTPVR